MAVLFVIKVLILIITSALACLYIGSIGVYRSFYTRNNIFTVNLATAALICSLYWMVFFILAEYSHVLTIRDVCFSFIYLESVCTIQVPLAMIAVSLHRLFTIVYRSKEFLKRRHAFAVFIISQWLLGAVLSLP
jgi:hypothetical protein